MQVVGDEEAVFANEGVVEIDFAAAVFWGLDEDEVPVDGGVVAVWCVFIAATRREVDAAADFFVEENVFHRLGDVGIDADAEFTDVAGAVVGVEDDVEFVGFVGGCLDDFAVFKGERDVFKNGALIERWGVVSDGAVHAVAHRCGVDFAVWDVAFAGAFHCRNAVDRKAQVGARADNVHLIRRFEPCNEGIHGAAHFCVVEVANVVVKIFKGAGAHAGELSHGAIWIAQHDPLAVVDAFVKHIGIGFVLQRDAFLWHIAVF